MSRAGDVSVVIPAFNAGATLGRAIRSVLQQTLQPAEIIVVDDGSTDDTTAIASLTPGIVCIRQDNAGPAAARNHGVARSQGRLIAFLDADDEWLVHTLARQAAALACEPSAGFVAGRARFVLDPGARPPAGFRQELLAGDHLAWIFSTIMVRREAFEVVGQLDPTLRLAEDVDWIARARDAGVRVVAVDDVLAIHHVHDRGLSAAADREGRTLLEVLHRSVRRKRGRAVGVSEGSSPAPRPTSDGGRE